MSIHVRPFQDQDFPQLLRIDQSCFEPGIAYDDVALDYFVYQIYSHTLVLVVNSTIVGFGIAAIASGKLPSGHIITLDLLPEVRGQGHGRWLLRQLETRLVTDGVAEVSLEVDVRNKKVVGFYRKMGYGQERRLKDYYGKGRDALRMVRSLVDFEMGTLKP